MAKKKATLISAGIDVSSRDLKVAMDLDGVVTDSVFENSHTGHQALIRVLTKDGRHARVCLEATGTYSLDLSVALARHKRVEVMVLNPKAARKFAEAQMRRAKTDQVDARSLLDFVRSMPFQAWAAPSSKRLELRAMSRRITSLVGDRVREENRLAAASATVETPAVVLSDMEASIRQLEVRIDQMTDAVLTFVRADAEFSKALDCVASVKGIGDRSGIAILAELLLLPEDMSPNEVVAHCGLDPRPKQSGMRDGPRSISKIGNDVVRGAMFMPAMCAARFEPAVRAFYERLLARGKPKMVALVAVMRRLLRIVWVLYLRKATWDSALFAPRPAPTAAA